MKKILSLGLALVFIFTAAYPCYAATTNEDIDAALLARGYPADALTKMSAKQKFKLYQDTDLIYVDSFTLTYSEDASETSVQPYGQISVDDLEFTFHISCAMDSDTDTLKYIDIQFHYDWKNIPVSRFQDPVALSWDDDLFRLKDDSFSKVDKFSGFFSDVTGELKWVYDSVHSSEAGYANASAAGVSWYADLKGNIGITVTELYGYGSFQLVPKDGVTIHSETRSTLYAHYVHPIVSIGASIAIKTYGSFNISGGGIYDECGTQRTFTVADAAG